MKKIFLLIIVAVLASVSGWAQVSFVGGSHEVYDLIPEKNTGLNHIYVLYNTQGVGMQYRAMSDTPVVWYSFGSQGGGYAEEISGITTDGRTTTLAQVIAGQGYIIEEGTNRTYVWVVNYADHYLRFNSISALAPEDCGTATLSIDGSADEISYFTITGVRRVLSREIKLNFRTLVWDETDRKSVV